MCFRVSLESDSDSWCLTLRQKKNTTQFYRHLRQLLHRNKIFSVEISSIWVQPPLASSDLESYLQVESFTGTSFGFFGTLAERGRERKGAWSHQPLPPLVLRAPSSGQSASQAQTDTRVMLRAPNSGLRLEREGRLNHYYLPQNFLSS